MKTKQQIISSRPVYLNDWADSKKFGVIMDFENVYMSKAEFIAKKSPYPNEQAWKENKIKAKKALAFHKDDKILFASYTYENYSGSAWVLFTKKGKLYEINGSHCSCYGLEGQWEPEEVNLKALAKRLVDGTFGAWDYGNEFKTELIKFLGLTIK